MTKVSTSKAASWSLRFQKTFGAILAAVALVIVFLPAFTPSTAHADDPIYSPGNALGEKKSVSGRVYLDRAGSRSYMEPTDKQGASDGDIGLPGVKVYAQWTDYNNRRQKGALSPVYYTQGRADGTYVIQLPDWTDAFGTVHKWEATAGQTLRIWADNPDPSKYTLAFVEGDSTFGGQGDRYRGTWNGVIGFNLAENYNIAFQERPQFAQMFPPENTWKQSSREGGGGDVVGKVWYEEREALGNSEAVPTFRPTFGETLVPGVKVVGAYVQDEVARRFDAWKKDHKNYKRDEFKAAQREIMKAYEAETGKSAIAETVYDTTDANGQYHLQFQGLWGNSYSAKGIMNAGTWGELVPEGAKASWAKANLRSRHVNTEYMYVAPEIPNGVGGSLNNFRDNMYQDGLNWTPNATTGAISNVENVNFALRMEGRDFHIETYDQTTNPAKPGDTAPTKATGFVPNNTYDIVWTDGDGKEVKTCTSQASNLGVVESCPLTVPADLDKDEIYTASIYPEKTRDRAMVKDSFAAKVTPEYKATTIDLDDTATVAAPINKENGTTPPADTTYAAAAASDVPASLLKGVDQTKVTMGAQPWAKVNSDGTIALSPTTGNVTPGSYLIPVKLTYGKGKDAFERVILAPVTVKEPDSDGDGTPDASDNCPKIAGPSSNNGCPAWGDGSGAPGTDVTLTKDKDNGPLPEGTVCATDPAGATCKVGTDGNITVTVPGDAKPDAVIKVTVKDKDGKKLDESNVTVTKPGVKDYNPGYGNAVIVKPDESKAASPVYAGAVPPLGTTYKIKDGWTAPAGWTVSVDAASGAVTAKAPAKPNVQTAEEITVPVVVTYPDGAVTDETSAIFQLDTDGDGIPDVTDDDDDNDGIPDADENTNGTDPKNPDTDGDGVSDGREKDLGTDPKNSDTDGDGLTDGEEAGTDIDDKGNPVKDENGKPKVDDSKATKTDPTKADTDGDGVSDGREKDLGTDPKNSDTDGDGLTDGEEAGTDIDDKGNPVKDENGKPKVDDSKATKTDPTKPDSDGDGVNEGKDASSDQCPLLAGPSSNKGCPAWGDGSGNPGSEVTLPKDDANGKLPNTVKCEADKGATCAFDNDGNVKVTVPADAASGTTITVTVKDGDKTLDSSTVTVTKPSADDTDGDGVSDEREKELGTDPNNPDTDGDGLTDGQEVGTDVDKDGKAVKDENGKPKVDDSKATKTDPTKADTDGDGINDGDEVNGTKNPFKGDKADPNGKPGNTDPNNADTDGDGINDGDEVTGAKNGGKATNPNKADTDGDGINDGQEIKDGTDPLNPNDPGKKGKGTTKVVKVWQKLPKTGSAAVSALALGLLAIGAGAVMVRRRKQQ
ncbi:YPDG domain-containing protein [Varibaculum cambriense]|nr:YPDG domain-containing protein [Varibaculum cambriense]